MIEILSFLFFAWLALAVLSIPFCGTRTSAPIQWKVWAWVAVAYALVAALHYLFN
jgi:hypothetical protein